MTDIDPALFLGWTAGTRADAERFAREVCAEHGLTRRQVQVSAAPSGWDVHRRPASIGMPEVAR
jgi:hypothetical protein